MAQQCIWAMVIKYGWSAVICHGFQLSRLPALTPAGVLSGKHLNEQWWATVQYVPYNMHTGLQFSCHDTTFYLLSNSSSFMWRIYPYTSGCFHWHCHRTDCHQTTTHIQPFLVSNGESILRILRNTIITKLYHVWWWPETNFTAGISIHIINLMKNVLLWSDRGNIKNVEMKWSTISKNR